jgi:hypothetical protein
MAKKKAIKKVVCSVLIFLIVMSVIPVSVCGIPDQTLIQTFTPTAGTVAGSTGPASEATSTTSLPYESIQSDGYGHYIKFLLYGPEEVDIDEIVTYTVQIESVDSDGNPIPRIIMKGNAYTCYKDDAVEIYPVSIKERWNERWYDIDPEQDWDEDSIMKAVCGDLMSLAIAIPGLGTLLALFTENPPKPAWAVFYDENTYDTIQIPFTLPTKWGSRYVPLVGEQPHPSAVELWIPYKFTGEGSHQIYFFMWAQGMAPSSPVNTSDFYITVEATTVTPQPVPSTDFTNTIGPAGEFDMGSPPDEEDRDSDEGPVHHVHIGKAFYMCKYEVTQKQWHEIMGDDPSYFKGDDLPVEKVSWDDVQEFIKKLNEKEGTDKYRLPSEAEWEYACRAGTTTRHSFGDDESNLGNYGWYVDNSDLTTHQAGLKLSNPRGLYDMHGNVYEWVQDERHSNYDGAPTDGSAWESGYYGANRVLRGGSWNRGAWRCRSANRGRLDPRSRVNYLGFRILKEV